MAVLLTCINLSAQMPGDNERPVRWRLSAKMTSPTEGVATLYATVDDGWHLYGTSLPENGPVPTSFDFDKSQGIVFTGDFTPSEAPQTVDDSTFGMKLDLWDKNVRFTRTFRLDGSSEAPLIAGSVRYMCCDDINCMPPVTLELSAKPKP